MIKIVFIFFIEMSSTTFIYFLYFWLYIIDIFSNKVQTRTLAQHSTNLLITSGSLGIRVVKPFLADQHLAKLLKTLGPILTEH